VIKEGASSNYIVCLLRLWQVETEAGTSWRMLIEDPRTAERRGFADLADLLAYLSDLMEATAPPLTEDSEAPSSGDTIPRS
jgi:hypothetical protein